MWGRSKLIINLSVLLLISFAIYNIWVPRFRGADVFVSYLSYPVVVVNHKITEWKNYLLFGDIQKKNLELQNLVNKLQADSISFQSQSKYWADVKELVEFSKRYKYKDKILSQVLFRYFKPQEHYFLLDKGEKDGVKRGMIAVYKNTLLGRVANVYPQYCRLILVTDRLCKVAVYAAKTKAVGICKGTNDKNKLFLNYVSHLQHLKLDDDLISSGEGGAFPQGFGVAKVSSFRKDGMYYKAFAKPLIDLSSVKYCYLIDSTTSKI